MIHSILNKIKKIKLTLLPPPTFEKIHPTFSAEQWPTNCQPCLAAWSSGTGFAGIAGYAWSLAFGSADICFQVRAVFLWSDGVDFSIWLDGTWGRWVWRGVTSNEMWKIWHLPKKPLWPSSSFKLMLVGIPSFFSFHVQGCQVACQNMCLSERQKCRKVFE